MRVQEISSTKLSDNDTLMVSAVSDVFGSGFEWEIRGEDGSCHGTGFGDTPDEALEIGMRVWNEKQAEIAAIGRILAATPEEERLTVMLEQFPEYAAQCEKKEAA